MHSVLGNHKTMIHQYTVIVVIHVYNRIIVFTPQEMFQEVPLHNEVIFQVFFYSHSH